MSIAKLVQLGMVAAKNNFGELDHPYKLNFCVTYRCQSRCLTCNIWQMRPEGELTIREIEKFAEKNPHFRWLQLTGGEPFLRTELVEIIKIFQRSSRGLYVVTIPTNSLCRREKTLKTVTEILETGLPKLVVTLSLDGYRELHDRVRGVPGNYDKAIALYKDLIALRATHKNLVVFFGYTLSKHNQGQLQKTIDAVRDEIPSITPSDIHVNLAQYSDFYYKNTDLELSPEGQAAVDELKHFLRQRHVAVGAIPLIEKAFLSNLVRYVEQGTTSVRSRSLDASLYLDSFGDVYPSIMWNKKIGNIRETGYDLAPLWHNERAAEARRLIAAGEEPSSWTACEATQALVADLKQLFVQ